MELGPASEVAMKKETREPREIDKLLKILIHSRSRLSELLAVCTTQRDAGALKVLRESTVQAERLLDEIRALEATLDREAPDGLIFLRSSAPPTPPTASTR
jgi:hypothetical protein